jgi:hypothetical protein
MSARAIGARLDLDRRTVARRVRSAGGKMRGKALSRGDCEACGKELITVGSRWHWDCQPHMRKYPRPTPRECELESCHQTFVPQAGHVARGAGRFCSYKHWNLYRTGKPQSEWRP